MDFTTLHTLMNTGFICFMCAVFITRGDCAALTHISIIISVGDRLISFFLRLRTKLFLL